MYKSPTKLYYFYIYNIIIINNKKKKKKNIIKIMKYILILLVAILTTSNATQTFTDKCTCADDYFVAKLHDERRCLAEEGDDHGIANCEAYSWTAGNGLTCTKCAATHAIDARG